MILQLTSIKPDGSSFEGEDPVEAFEWVEVTGDIVHPAGPIRWNLDVKLFGTELYAEGKAAADFAGVCARCGGEMTLPVVGDVCMSMEISAETVEVDLTSELRDAILLALPNHPVCGPGCKGLCPRCGKPLADGPCPCADSTGAGAWDVLDKLIPPQTSTTPKSEPPHGRTKTQKIKDARPHAPRAEEGRNRQRDRLP